VSDIEGMLAAALAHHDAGRGAEAEVLCRTILQVEPQIAATEHLLGTIALQSGHVEAARGRFMKALALARDVALYHRSLGDVETRLGRYDEALASYGQVLVLDPADLLVHDRLSTLARHRPLPVLAFYREAAEQAQDDAGLQFRYANALFHADRSAEAVPVYRRTLALVPDRVAALDNLGLALSDLGQLDEAIACLRRSIELQPEAPNSHNNLALALLLKGDYAAAWPHHEYGRPPATPRACPLWDGGLLGGARILLHAEQGFGDTLQFVRYAPLVAARGGKVVLEVQPSLVRLLASLPGVSRIVTAGTAVADVACHSPLFSLPHIFRTGVATIPAVVPYVAAPPDRTPWGQRIPGFLSRRVGLAWQGQKAHRRDRDRSLPLEALAPLAAVSGVSFYSVQKQGPEGVPPAGLHIEDLSDGFEDFGDTAAAIKRLDLVITVDTSIAHLAGALGKPVWILLAHTPDWRWLLERTDSPWYPTARLFRQPRAGDWASVLHQVAEALRSWGG
jgi:tetratricopeptide (TPR) repeat protein